MLHTLDRITKKPKQRWHRGTSWNRYIDLLKTQTLQNSEKSCTLLPFYLELVIWAWISLEVIVLATGITGQTPGCQYLLVLFLQKTLCKKSNADNVHPFQVFASCKHLDCHCYYIPCCMNSFVGLWNSLLGSQKICCSGSYFSLLKTDRKTVCLFKWSSVL